MEVVFSEISIPLCRAASKGSYIFKKQLGKSDIILITKTDSLAKEELAEPKEKVKMRFPASRMMNISSYSQEGLDEWLEIVLYNTAHRCLSQGRPNPTYRFAYVLRD